MKKRRILLNPGPATTTDSVKEAQVIPDVCHREKEFKNLMDSISRDLVKIAGGDENYGCVLFGGSGTAVMESVITSSVPEDGKILIINNGAYGKRMVKIAQTYSIANEELFFDWDEEIDFNALEKALQEEDITNLAMVHHETTTGILNPVKEIGELAKKYDKLFIADTVSSFAGIPLDIQDSNIDFMFSTSNKCIQGMAGIAFVIAKRDELEKTKHNPQRSFYLNLYEQYKSLDEENQMRFTPPVQTMYALRKAIDEFFEEGAENRYSRYRKNCETLVQGMQELGFRKIYQGREESSLLTTFWEPENPRYSFDEMHDLLYAREFTIYPGKIEQKTFRLANMGDIDSEDIKDFLNSMKEVVNEMGMGNNSIPL